jgi:hypothetical protein
MRAASGIGTPLAYVRAWNVIKIRTNPMTALQEAPPAIPTGNRLDEILSRYHGLNDDEPFIVYLTERLLSDIEAAHHADDPLRLRQLWSSLN